MKQHTFTCDRCKAVRQPSNHWILAKKHATKKVISFFPWNDQDASDANTLHLCSAQCCIGTLSDNMNELQGIEGSTS